MRLTAGGALASAVLSWFAVSASSPADDHDRSGLQVTVTLDQRAGSAPVATLRAESFQHGSGTDEPAEAATREWRFEAPWQGRLELDCGLSWHLTLTADGYWASPVDFEPARSAGQVRMRLIPTGRLVGRAVSPGPESMPAALNLLLESSPSGREQEQVSVERAGFSCPIADNSWACEIPSGRWDLRLAVEGYVPHYRWGVEIQSAQETSLGELRFQEGASLAGWIEVEGGEPGATPAEVELKPQVTGFQDDAGERRRFSTLAAHAKADERGFFQLTDLAPGGYTLSVSKPGFASEQIHSIVLSEGSELRLGSPVVLSPPATLEVFLEPPVDPPGQPWEVVLIQPQPSSHVAKTVERSAASLEGHWRRADLERGTYRLEVRDARGSSWLAREIEVEPAMSPLFLQLEALPIKGSVSIGDEPLETTLVFGTLQRRPNIRIASDEEGHFEGYLPHGGTWLVELLDEGSQLTRTIEPVEVRRRPGKTYAEFDISLPDTRLTGEVVQDDEPVADALVLVLQQDQDRKGKSATHRTSSEGKFELRGISPGEHYVSAYLGHFDPASDWVRVDLQAGRSPHVRLELRGKVELTGRVISSSGGVPGALVIANPAVPFGWPDKTVTSADGTFTLEVSENASAVNLMVLAAGFGFDLQRVTPDHGRNSPVVILLEASSGSLVVSDPRIFGHTLHRKGGAVPLADLRPILRQADRIVSNPLPTGGFAYLHFAPGEYALCPGTELREDLCSFGELPPYGELILTKP